MYDNHRDSFQHRQQDDERRNGDPAERWRRSEERYRREGYGDAGRSDDDRWEAQRGQRDFGRGRAYRSADWGNRDGYRGRDWSEPRGYDLRDYYAPRDYDRPSDYRGGHWHEHDHDHRAGYPYSGTYGGTGDSSYFTGQQGSWAVGDPRVRSRYGPAGAHGGGSYEGEHYGIDYRSHGYSDHDDRRGFWDRAGDEVASWFGDEDAAHRREEDHRGRGPKNYTRSDERIREDANDRLTDDPLVDASEITVAVSNGEITLNGTVHGRLAKRRAEDAVDRISGVRHVQNNLRVRAVAPGEHRANWPLNRTSTVESSVTAQAGTAKTDKL
jgi:osmotically-inducible protein OsmY